jgi:hypothetical protein
VSVRPRPDLDGRSSSRTRDPILRRLQIPETRSGAGELACRQSHFGWWRDRLPDSPPLARHDVRIPGSGGGNGSAAAQELPEHPDASTELTHRDDAWRSLCPGSPSAPGGLLRGLTDACRRHPSTLNLTACPAPRA